MWYLQKIKYHKYKKTRWHEIDKCNTKKINGIDIDDIIKLVNIPINQQSDRIINRLELPNKSLT